MKIHRFFILLCLIISNGCFATEKTTIRIGVQAGGTVEWELSALPASADFQIETHPVATAEAGKIALQSGAVDMIVSDWIWVSSLRAQGEDFTFYPYSSTAGALVVPENSPIHSVKDLNGKRLGIAGGELDKNWLLLQALAQKDSLDLNKTVEKTFGAPPLISEQLKQNRVDAALTYWHFAARLEATGYRQIIDGRGILKGLGIEENVPSLGYVFKESWGLSHKPAVASFFKASSQAKKSICTDDAAWQKVIPLTKVDDTATQKLLRQRYCEGSIEQWGEKEQQAAAHIYTLLKNLSNNQLTGKSETLQAGTFWSGK
ncbi:MAG: NitT/TauT family transport system substrate-binding protein [Methylococcaceae bacterium NSP1-2]|nr:transporter substrate-binding domain-containing protein [Methylococcaceae bacterium]OYV16747.1 MAG: NitT/TauT family transport system substrate-binding protein [Methylococcaceae bacterium NSP1-2]